MLSCALKRLQQPKQRLHALHAKGIYPIEYKFNGSANHWRDIVETQTYTCATKLKPELSELFERHFETLGLTKEKAFIWTNITPSSHILFKNTTFQQSMTCKDEVYVWNYGELKSLSDFYRNFYGNSRLK